MDRLSSTTVIPDAFQGAKDDITTQFALIWSQIKAPLIVPLLRIAVFFCLIMSMMMFIERVYMGIVITLVKLFGRKPEKRYKWEPMKDDVELGNSSYPMVLVQVPMYNEREVLFQSLSYLGCSNSQFVKYSIFFVKPWFGFELHVLVNAGLSAFNWSCMWTFLAFR